jgi:ferredoxin
MDVEIRVDRTRCIGSGQCVYVAPGAFDQDGEAKAFVSDQRGEPEEKIVHAVTACPVQAISLYVDGTLVEADDLKDWAHGARSDHPVVPILEQLCEDHHELQKALTEGALDEGLERTDEICALTRVHLRNEEAAYSAMTALVDPALVDAFLSGHANIDLAMDAVAACESDSVSRDEAVKQLASAVSDHIRVEETVLFPVTLAALARS